MKNNMQVFLGLDIKEDIERRNSQIKKAIQFFSMSYLRVVNMPKSSGLST